MIPIASNSNGHKAILVSLAAIFMLLGCAPKGYVKYRPVDYDMHRGGYFFSKSPISNEHLKGIKFVFDYYGVDYIEKDSQTLFIQLSLLQDTNFVFNCTEKADDSIWMKYKMKELEDGITTPNKKDSSNTEPLLISNSTKGELINAYFANSAGTPVVLADTVQTIFFYIITKNLINDTLVVDFSSDAFLFECKEHPLDASFKINNLKVTTDTVKIELKVLGKKKGTNCK